MKTIAVLGTYDTKGEELQFVAQRIRKQGLNVLLVDVSTQSTPTVEVDVAAADVLSGGNESLEQLRGDRGACVAAMGRAAAQVVSRLASEGNIQGIISLGGGGGTSIATTAMRTLPVGFPKLMVSTVASGDTSNYIASKDIVMFPSVVDVAGLNRVSRTIFAQAAAAIGAMVDADPQSHSTRPLVVASMFGNTTKCIEIAKSTLESAGFEVLVFHATGSGGRAMEDLIASGMVDGVLDITTTELADELLGGIMSAGPTRLTAAGIANIPAVIAPGCLDMANFGPIHTLPDRYRSRTIYQHNPDNTLVRTNSQDCRQLGKTLAERVNAYSGPVTVMIPTKAISVISAKAQPFCDPEADNELFDAIQQTSKPVVRIDAEINEMEFASAAAKELLRLMRNANKKS